MQELALIPMVNGASTRLMDSALPGSPQVPEHSLGRLRSLVGEVLHHLVARPEREHPIEADRSSRPALGAHLDDRGATCRDGTASSSARV